jgi:predicted amidohydrolase
LKVKIGVVQPWGFLGEEAKKQPEMASKYIEEGAIQGAQILCFPEWYPGPPIGPMASATTENLRMKAKEYGIYLIAGGLEEGKEPNSYYTSHHLIAPNGDIVGTYRRTTSAGPNIYETVFQWGDRRLLWGNELPVFQTEYGNVGILFCSEVYTPELARVLALKGADMIFLPSGGLFWTWAKGWKNLIWARAIENLVYTAACGHIFGVEEGIATIAGPEEILAESTKEGVITAEIDLERTAWLRNIDAPASAFLVGVNPGRSSGLGFFNYKGLLSRRPDLYEPICMNEEQLKAISRRSTP